MAGVSFGSAALGGVSSVAAAAYQASIVFMARHEATHAQQIGTTKQYIAEFVAAYKMGDVSEEDWKEYLLLRDKDSEKAYEDSIDAYKDAPMFRLIKKWRLKQRVREKKKQLRQSNISLRSHYDGWSSGVSDASSISAEYGSPPRSRESSSHEDNKRISKWIEDVATSESAYSCEDEKSEQSEREICVEDPLCLHVLKPKDVVISLSFSADSKQIIAGVLNGQIKIWDMHERQMSVGPLVWRADGVACVAFSPDGNQIVLGSRNRTVRILDKETGICNLGSLSGHSDYIRCVAFSPDGDTIVSGSKDQTIRIWDVQTGRLLAGPLSGHTGAVRSVIFSPDSKTVASTSDDCTIRIWGARTGATTMGPLTNDTNSPFICAAFHPSGEFLLSVSEDGTIYSWNVERGLLLSASLKKIRPYPSYVSFSQNCSFVVSGTATSNTLAITNVLTGESMAEQLKGHTDRIRCIAVSPDGRRVASGSWDKTIRIWDIAAFTDIFEV